MTTAADQLQYVANAEVGAATTAPSIGGLTVGFLLRRLDCLDGIASHCETLMRNLTRNGVRVVMLTGPIYCEPTMQSRLDNLKRLSSAWINLDFPNGRLKLNAALVRRVRTACLENGIDVLHLHGVTTLPLGKLVSWTTGIPVIMTRHLSGYTQGVRPSFKRKVALSAAQPLLRLIGPTRSIAICSDMKNWYVDDFRQPERNVDLVLHGADTRQFHPPTAAEREAARTEMKVSDDQFVVCSIGRVGFEKGHDVLIRAIAQLIHKGRNVRLIIAGTGTELEQMRGIAQSLGIEPHVHFTGFTLNVRQVLWASDAFVLASKREGFPLVAVEAMLCGVVPLRTPGFGTTDQITHEDNGFVFPFGDSDTLATQLDRLAEDQTLRRRMRARSLAMAASRFDAVHMTHRTMAVYAPRFSQKPHLAAEGTARMNLVIVTHNLIRGDGQGRVNLEVAQHCLRAGHHVTLVCGDVDKGLLDAGARWIPLYPKFRRPMIARVREFVARANHIVAKLEKQADVIVANGYTLTRRHHVNASHFVHSAWLKSPANPHQNKGGGFKGWYQRQYASRNCRWELASYRAASTVIAVSQNTRQELLDIGLPAEKLRVIPNGVDLNEFRPGESDRAAVGLPAHVPMALFAGDLRTSRKNLDTVLNALVNVTGLHLAVIGRTERSAYPAMAADLGVADRVHFLGFRKDAADVMRACEFFIFPSRYEPFGLVVLEAMASGLPAIVSASAGASEYVTPDIGVVLNDANDVAACAAAMRRLAADPVLTRRMGLAGRAAAEKCSWNHVGAAYLDVFTQAASRPPASAGREILTLPASRGNDAFAAQTPEVACQ